MTSATQPARASRRVARKPARTAQAEVPAGEPRDLSKRWREPFFAKLAETSNIAAACEHAAISRAAVYDLRRRDAGFAARWMEALAEGYDNLEMDLLHQLRSGEAKDGPKYNVAAGLRMLQQHRENVMREKARRANVDAASVRASIDRKIAEMRALVLAEKMAEKMVAQNRTNAPDGEADAGD